jgi:nicotinamidase-related amidase
MITPAYPDRTALLIVDPCNDFMSEGGKHYEATRATAEAVGFYDNMRSAGTSGRTS